MIRKRPRFIPLWEGAIEGWVVNFITKNVWRTKPAYDWCDLYQESYLCYDRCVHMYPEVVEAPHFMRLVQVTTLNRITDLANKRTKRREVPMEVGDEDSTMCLLDMVPNNMLGISDYENEEWKVMKDSPQLLRRLVRVLTASDVVLAYRVVGGIRETTNELLCRLVGVDSTRRDLVGYLRSYLSGEVKCTEYLSQFI